MKIKEIIVESNYTSQLHSDLDNLLVAAKASGLTEVPVEKLVLQLNKLGYSVSPESLPSAFDENPVVQSSTPTHVQLTRHEGSEEGGGERDPEQDADTVSRMAVDQANSSITDDGLSGGI